MYADIQGLLQVKGIDFDLVQGVIVKRRVMQVKVRKSHLMNQTQKAVRKVQAQNRMKKRFVHLNFTSRGKQNLKAKSDGTDILVKNIV